MKQYTSKPTEQEIINQSWGVWLKKTTLGIVALAVIVSFLPLDSGITVIIVALVPSLYGLIKISTQDLKAFNARNRDLIKLGKSSSKEDFKEQLYGSSVTPLKRSSYSFKGILALAALIVVSLLLSGLAVAIQDALYRS